MKHKMFNISSDDYKEGTLQWPEYKLLEMCVRSTHAYDSACACACACAYACAGEELLQRACLRAAATGSISMCLGFLSKMTTYQSVNYKKQPKKQRKYWALWTWRGNIPFRIFIQDIFISCLWDFYPRWFHFNAFGIFIQDAFISIRQQ